MPISCSLRVLIISKVVQAEVAHGSFSVHSSTACSAQEAIGAGASSIGLVLGDLCS